MFLTLGRFVGKALLDDRLVDLPFSNAFFRAALKRHDIGLRDVAELDPSLARALSRLLTLADRAQALLASGVTAQKVEAAVTLDGVSICELCLDFTLPGEAVPLCEGGGEKAVTACNLHEYVPLVIRTLLVTAVEAQLNAFRQGFEEVLPLHHLCAFSEPELDVLLNGQQERWEREVVLEALRYDHGYSRDSRAVAFLVDVLCELSAPEQANFVRFVTGSPRLPIGGLAKLSPPLTIVQKKPEGGEAADAYLPSVMTCANYLKLPNYSTKAVMRQRLLTACEEGQGSFLLS
mmetsp:Transcript_16005/g.37085  ORF Transcript_16005/g.37085 Transcript_16005/m.37085 type:complete len:291 (+) Transcript_16005:442-1314(+)